MISTPQPPWRSTFSSCGAAASFATNDGLRPGARRRCERPTMRAAVADGAGGPPPLARPASPMATPPGFWSQAVRIAVKDLAIEWKSREILFTSGFLAVVVVLVFSFAFV